ncbi:hypothetical protein PFICI_07634 [Pestalotiopsis fici W106-1]|uniref:DUF2235 domain-containing protein n=1 Tax=Pestalotiopsis fici (strain W106-1 / CGMCC3.15140) TaxID=1229662 RepID=W3X200_PESFW|nr:uncharacterized protein PFICI_07634 [Pestalotiopsis fici W106-1]ETS80105.1 hypothetical protein PFICI_07634 [Pestalotiopsis fici W106-1]
MSESRTRNRIIACVDGTWFNADGQEGQGQGNNSNISRINWSIKNKTFRDADGCEVKQTVKYFYGIGVGQSVPAKLNAGITGKGCDEQIHAVHEFCVNHAEGPNDEFWFFGFSRGAYVVRAVAKLLSGGVVKRFEDSSERKRWKNMILGRRKNKNNGERFEFSRTHSSYVPVIKFLGLFDTVEMTTLNYDITIPGGCIETIRHAMALNEHRLLRPLSMVENPGVALQETQSTIQAWFIGCHEDMGGGALHDGLSLYPLQWILQEARARGLVLEHPNHLPQDVDDPLDLVFPVPDENTARAVGPALGSMFWHFRYSNGFTIPMHDLRAVHREVDLADQSRKLKKRAALSRAATHDIRLNPGRFDSMEFGKRAIFVKNGELGELVGYSGSSRSGTIIHPAVYFLMDAYYTRSLAASLKGIQSHLEVFRENASLKAVSEDGTASLDTYPWIKDFTPSVAYPSCRILICGNNGVGKSTLLNRVFGLPMSAISHGKAGVHDIEEGFQDANHPGIIIHDSEGFQAGGTKEVKAFNKFLADRCGQTKPEEKLHAIWFCIESGSSRPVQTVMANVLAAVAKAAPNIPIIIVCTKKDEYLTKHDVGLSWDEVKSICRDTVDEASPLMRRQREILDLRQKAIIEIIEGGEAGKSWKQLQDVHFQFVFAGVGSGDASLSQLYDARSIRGLIQTTVAAIGHTFVTDGMIAAQIQDLEAKIDLAIEKTLQFLRRAIINSTAGAGLVFSSAIGTPTIARLLCNEIVTNCYGIPEYMANKVEGLLNKIVGRNTLIFLAQSLGQSSLIWGGVVTMTLFTLFGGIPLALGAPLLEAPPAARMVLKCACDLIIILDRAFRLDGANKFVSYDKIRTVTLGYVTATGSRDDGGPTRSRRSMVHSAVNELIPLISDISMKGFKEKNVTRYRSGVKETIMKHRYSDADSRSIASETNEEQRLSSVETLEEDQEEEVQFGKVITNSEGGK